MTFLRLNERSFVLVYLCFYYTGRLCIILGKITYSNQSGAFGKPDIIL